MDRGYDNGGDVYDGDHVLLYACIQNHSSDNTFLLNVFMVIDYGDFKLLC